MQEIDFERNSSNEFCGEGFSLQLGMQATINAKAKRPEKVHFILMIRNPIL